MIFLWSERPYSLPDHKKNHAESMEFTHQTINLKNMKKTLFAVLTTAMIAVSSLFLFSCGSSSQAEENVVKDQPRIVEAPAEPPAAEPTKPREIDSFYTIDGTAGYAVSEIVTDHPGHEGGEDKELTKMSYVVAVIDNGDTIEQTISANDWFIDKEKGAKKKIDLFDREKFKKVHTMITSTDQAKIVFSINYKSKDGRTEKTITNISIKGRSREWKNKKFIPATPNEPLWNTYDSFRKEDYYGG